MTIEHKARWTIVASIIGTVAASVGIFSQFGGWPNMGWTSPLRHDGDIAAVRAQIESKLHAADEETREFRREWRCSEWAEDLDDLYTQQDAGDASQRLRDRIEDKREQMDEQECWKYEDY